MSRRATCPWPPAIRTSMPHSSLPGHGNAVWLSPYARCDVYRTMCRPSSPGARRAPAETGSGARPSSSAASLRMSARRITAAPAIRSGSGGTVARRRVDERQPGDRVAAVERERGERAAEQVRRRRRRCRCSRTPPRPAGRAQPDDRRAGAWGRRRSARPRRARSRRPASWGKKRTRSALDLRDDVRVDLHPPARARAGRHPAAGPAEDDPVVARRAHVVQQRAPVGDRLAAAPAELVEHVRHRLGADDVAGGDREPVAQRRQRPARRVDGEHRHARPDPPAARGRDREPVGHRAHAGRPAALEDRARRGRAAARAARTPAAPGARSRSRARTRRRGTPASRSAPAPPRRPGRARVVAVDRLGADAVLRRRRRDAQLAAAPVPRVDALGLAPRADRVDRRARGVGPRGRRRLAVRRRAASGRLRSRLDTKPPLRPLGPCPQRPASSSTTRASGSASSSVPGRPHAGVAAADHDDVGPRVALERREHGRAARLGDPEAVRVVQHQAKCARSAAATAARSTSRSARRDVGADRVDRERRRQPGQPFEDREVGQREVQQRVAALEHRDDAARRTPRRRAPPRGRPARGSRAR